MNAMLAYIDGDNLISTLIYVICVGAVFALLFWLIGYVALPEPFAKVARIVLAIAAVIFLISIIMSFAGHPLVRW